MERILDFIVPEYNTNKQLLERALNSINRQKNLDFKEIGVIIVSDGSKEKYKKSWFKQKFPKLNIEYYPKEVNEGPGLTRQYGIDKSKAMYISFLDSDDELYGDNLGLIVKTLALKKYNILWTNFIEEAMLDGKIYVKAHRPLDFPTLHGLFVNRDFLCNNNIRFSSEIRYQEDTYFADLLIHGYGGEYADVCSYLWKYNDFSLVRSDKKINWNVKVIEDTIKSSKLLYKKLEELNKDIRHKKIVHSIFAAYIVLQSDDFKAFEDRKKDNMHELLELFNSVKEKSYDIFSENELLNMYKSQFETTHRTMASIKFDPTFMDYIKNK